MLRNADVGRFTNPSNIHREINGFVDPDFFGRGKLFQFLFLAAVGPLPVLW